MSSADPRSAAADDDRFRLAMASSGIGMAIVGLDGRWLEVNPALERMFGYAAAELVGQPVFAISHGDDAEPSRRYLHELLNGSRDSLDVQKRYLHKDGSVVWVQLNVAVMRDGDGRPAYFISQLRDITAQREAEDKLGALNEILERQVAQRTAELEVLCRQQELFAYGVAHDLRAPLRAIDSFSALLAGHSGHALDDTGRDYLERIRAAASRMSGLIDALMELSRVSRAELKAEAVDLSLLAEWSGAELQDAAQDRAAEIRVAPGLRARGDERQLKLLLVQLMHNAWKFSQGRERICIEVDGAVRDGRLLLSVRDYGLGFDMRYVERAFQPFQRLHSLEQGAGNGLGLPIAQRIVERHGGRIWADSQPGEGSTFYVELPAAAEASSAA